MKRLAWYCFIGACAGAAFKLSVNATIAQDFFQCVFFGMVGSFVAGLIKESSHHYLPIVHSWVAVVFLIFLVQYLYCVTNVSHTWIACLYGYLMYLIWEGYNHKLRKI